MRHVKRPVFSRISVVILTAVLVMTGGQVACGEKIDTSKIVKEMLAARQARTQIPYPTKMYGSFSIERAYQIQAELAKELSKELGPVVGYKAAYASKAAQEQFGVTEPASGPLFGLQRVPSGSGLPAGHFMEIALETEVAFTVGKRIDHAIKDVAQLKGYVKWIHAAFDAGDYPLVQEDTKPTAQDMIAAAHLRILRQRFKADGYTTPTPEQLALAWNRGYEGAKSYHFAPNDYALRDGNLFRLSQRGK
jgi:hypothetical protein